MKIVFTKLQTNANNISVKYDEAGEHIVNYPIEQIRSNNNEIEFDASYCNNLSNIEISTENGKSVTPTFEVTDEYNTLFEYFNRCKTQDWIIDEENFPNFWKKLFAPDYVFSDHLLYNINDPEIGENNSNNYVYTIENSSNYVDDEGNKYIRFDSGLQAFLQQYSDWNRGIFNLVDGQYKALTEGEFEDSGYLRTEYNFSPYTITKEESYILRTLEVGNTLFYCIVDTSYSSIYLIDKTVYDNASETDSLFFIEPKYIGSFNDTAEYNQYNLIGVPSYYYFKKVSPGTGHYTNRYNSYSKDSFRMFSPNGYEGEGDYEIEFVNDDTSFYADSGYYAVKTEFTNFLSKSTSYTTRNYGGTGIQSAYKVFIKGYNLLENEELSYKVYNLLARIQWYYSNGYNGTFYDSSIGPICFPYISYTSFNTNTLANVLLYYNDSPVLKNCNSIITLLGSRYVCNMHMSQYRNSLLYLPKGTQRYKDIDDGFNDTDITVIMHEEDLPDTVTLGYEYPSFLTILPDNVEHNKTITTDGYTDLNFIDTYGTIKGTYHINGYKPHDTYISGWLNYRNSNSTYHKISDKVPESWKSHFIENYENN
jgi:hypothetical protein